MKDTLTTFQNQLSDHAKSVTDKAKETIAKTADGLANFATDKASEINQSAVKMAIAQLRDAIATGVTELQANPIPGVTSPKLIATASVPGASLQIEVFVSPPKLDDHKST